MQPLRNSTLPGLAPSIRIPRYPRPSIGAGIAHIGVGAFHRAHLALFTERCLADADMRDWGLLGVNLLDRDRPLAEGLHAQENLYSLTEFASDGSHVTHIIGAIVEHLWAPPDPARVLERLTDPKIRIVSLTITEGGYLLDAQQGFRLEDPGVAHDLGNPDRPRTAFGFVVGALAKRRAAGVAPFTVLSCDNLRHNGAQARRAFTAYAEASSPGLARWMDAEVDFPNSMVDRITPAMDETRRHALNSGNGLDDRVPVACEDFIQWVVEDRFRQGRPAWERHGVQVVEDVTPYEEAKIRLLNGAHEMLSYPAYLSGHRLVHVAVEDPVFRGYLGEFLEKDAAPWIGPLAGIDVARYTDKLQERLRNPAIADRLERLCMDGGSKIPGFLGPTLAAILRAGGDARRLAFLLACFDRHVRHRRDDQGNPVKICEPHAAQLIERLIASGSALALLDSPELVGPEPARDRRFVAQYLALVESLGRIGVRRTLESLADLQP